MSGSLQLPPVTASLDSPSVARVYDYYLGGTTNWALDRSFADRILREFPLVRRMAAIERLFLNRTVRFLLGKGVRQFLDVGCGVPNTGATHFIVEDWLREQVRKRPRVRVVYVDNDPIAVAHGEVVLDRHGDRDNQAIVQADLRAPDALWAAALDTNLIDPTRPVALLLVAVLHIQQLDVLGRDIGASSVARLRDLLPRGSYVALTHASNTTRTSAGRTILEGLRRAYRGTGNDLKWRTRGEIESMLDGCRLVAPGWTTAMAWRPEQTGPRAPLVPIGSAAESVLLSGVGKKT